MTKTIQIFKKMFNFMTEILDNFGRGCKLRW